MSPAFAISSCLVFEARDVAWPAPVLSNPEQGLFAEELQNIDRGADGGVVLARKGEIRHFALEGGSRGFVGEHSPHGRDSHNRSAPSIAPLAYVTRKQPFGSLNERTRASTDPANDNWHPLGGAA